jgi:hypothetical protein
MQNESSWPFASTSKFLLTVDEVLHFEVEEGAGCQLVQSMQRFFFSNFFPFLSIINKAERAQMQLQN